MKKTQQWSLPFLIGFRKLFFSLYLSYRKKRFGTKNFELIYVWILIFSHIHIYKLFLLWGNILLRESLTFFYSSPGNLGSSPKSFPLGIISYLKTNSSFLGIPHGSRYLFDQKVIKIVAIQNQMFTKNCTRPGFEKRNTWLMQEIRASTSIAIFLRKVNIELLRAYKWKLRTTVLRSA